MGWGASQELIIGIKLDVSELEIEISPKVTEQQPRYNVHTGKVERYETVVVKDRVVKYQLQDRTFDDIYDIEEYCEVNGLFFYHDYDEKVIFIGIRLMEQDYLGRFDLLFGEMSFDKLCEEFDRAKKLLGCDEVKLIGFYRIT